MIRRRRKTVTRKSEKEATKKRERKREEDKGEGEQKGDKQIRRGKTDSTTQSSIIVSGTERVVIKFFTIKNGKYYDRRCWETQNAAYLRSSLGKLSN